MRIEIVRGSLTATAESVEDMQVLIAMSKPVRARGTAKKVEYKKVCPLCKKRVKYLVAHTKNVHAG